MALVLVVLGAAVLVGLVTGGSFGRFATLPLVRPWLVGAAVVAQGGGTLVGVLGVSGSGSAYTAGLALSAGCVIAFLARNRSVPGLPLVAAGLCLNAAVVAANGAMPVSLAAAARAGVGVAPIVAGTDLRHQVSGPGTRLGLLGDVVPVPLPARPEVVSPGDALIAAGLGLLVVAGMRRRPAREPGARPAQ